MVLNPDWKGKLITNRGTIPDKNQIKIFNNFERKEIFEHNFDADHLFKLFYGSSKRPKRQPNAFMIMRTVLGLVADNKKIKEKLGDGTMQSKLAGLIWGGASKDEKAKFRTLAEKFKILHTKRFPDYIFKPRPRSSEVGAVVDIKTAEDYRNNTSNYPPVTSNPLVPVSPLSTFEQPEELDKDLFIYGLQDSFIASDYYSQQFDPPSIAVNCLSFSHQDPNTSQITPLKPYSHPYNPSSTFSKFDDRQHTTKKKKSC